MAFRRLGWDESPGAACGVCMSVYCATSHGSLIRCVVGEHPSSRTLSPCGRPANGGRDWGWQDNGFRGGGASCLSRLGIRCDVGYRVISGPWISTSAANEEYEACSFYGAWPWVYDFIADKEIYATWMHAYEQHAETTTVVEWWRQFQQWMSHWSTWSLPLIMIWGSSCAETAKSVTFMDIAQVKVILGYLYIIRYHSTFHYKCNSIIFQTN